MKVICPQGSTCQGIDVSHYQSNVDYTGKSFVFIKASEGLFADSSFVTHWREATAAKVDKGAYHFFRPGLDALKQAEFFSRIVLSQLEKSELPLCMDWEVGVGQPCNERISGQLFLETVEKLTGRTPIIYGSPYFLESLQLDANFARYKLWISHYGVKCPKVPDPFTNWTFWQYDDGGGVLDHSLFNGSVDKLASL